jgi:4-hydroxy-3-polyprenylbenzoate decarboxylase
MLTQLAEMGAVIMPATPAFYQRPATLQDIVDQTANRVLDLCDVELRRDLFPRWTGGDTASEIPGEQHSHLAARA